MTRRKLAGVLGAAVAGVLAGTREARGASLDGAEQAAGQAALSPAAPATSPGWSSGPMTLQDLHDLTGGLLEAGVPPGILMAGYVDGRPGQPGPAVLRVLSWIKPEQGVPAGDRWHLVRQTGGPGTVGVVTLG